MEERPDVGARDALERPVGAFVSEDYRTAGVFEKHGIDFCCGGQISLSEACKLKALDEAALLREIDAARVQPLDRGHDYAAWKLPFLADYIVNTHHAYLQENLASLSAYARKIAEVHGEHHPEVIDIAALFDRIAADMPPHLREEEESLFPAIKRVHAARDSGKTPEREDVSSILASLETLGRDHEALGEAVHEIRRLSSDYAIPEGVCNTFVVTYRKLNEFENDLHKHVHLENNLLFPKAARMLETEEAVPARGSEGDTERAR